MTTTVARLTIYMMILLATPLFGEVFAQENEAISTTTEDVLATEPEDEKELWYKSERIFGNLEVGDFVVGPGRTELEVRPGESITSEITVTNRISDDREFRLEVEDIVGSSDGRSLISLSDGERSPYSVLDYISFPKESFQLELGERARIPVTITIPEDAEPGGFYGTVLVSTVRVGSSVENAPRSPIIARIGSLFFITVPGDIETEGEFTELSLIGNNGWWYEDGPIEAALTYENKGSIHLNPYGEISVRNMFGEEVGFVELEPWFVLPKAVRSREVSWDREFLFGRYTMTARVNRGYDDIVDTQSVTFWVLPWKIVGGVLLALFVILFSIRAFFSTFEFKRKGS